MSIRSAGAAARWQDRFDRLVLGAAIGAIAGVALQTLSRTGPVHALGVLAAAVAWAVFLLDAVVMLSVSPQPGRWARGHVFELVVLAASCPLWPVLLRDLLVLELLPALTVLEAAKLAKLVKVARAVRRSGSGSAAGRATAAGVLVAAAIVAGLVLTRP